MRGELIASSPCRGVRGGSDRAPECQLVSMAKVQEIPDAMPERFGAAIVLAWWGALRRGEILGLQRRHLDPSGSSVRVERAAVELSTGEILYGPPKTLAGVRTVHLPPQAAQVQADHVGPDPDDLVFTGRGVVQLRPKTLSTELRRVRALCGVPERRPAEPRPRS